MQPLEQELYDVVSHELHELAWHNNYALHPNVGLWCFLEGFRDHGVFVETQKDRAAFTATYDVGRRLYSLGAQLSLSEILDGWNRSPRGSPHALYDAICMVYDRFGENFQSREEKNEWATLRNTESKLVRRKMEKHLEGFFERHHEHVLLPVSRAVPELGAPRIFSQVLADYPLDLLKSAVIADGRSGFRVTPCAETLLEIDWDFDDEYHPSAAVLLDFFWGHYLDALAREKGYQLLHSGNRLRQLVGAGRNALESGYRLWKP